MWTWSAYCIVKLNVTLTFFFLDMWIYCKWLSFYVAHTFFLKSKWKVQPGLFYRLLYRKFKPAFDNNTQQKSTFIICRKKDDGLFLCINLWNWYRRKSTGLRKYSGMRCSFAEEIVMCSKQSPGACSEMLRGTGSSHSSQATEYFLSSMRWARHLQRGNWRGKRNLLVLLAGNSWKTSLLLLCLTTLVGK